MKLMPLAFAYYVAIHFMVHLNESPDFVRIFVRIFKMNGLLTVMSVRVLMLRMAIDRFRKIVRNVNIRYGKMPITKKDFLFPKSMYVFCM